MSGYVTVPRSGVPRRRRPLRLAAVLIGVGAVGMGAAITPFSAVGVTPPASGRFVAVTAASIVKTTAGTGWTGKLQPNATESVQATGVAGVPVSGVLAVMLHVSTFHSASPRPNKNGNVWVYPAGAARPAYATVANPPRGSVSDNTAIVRVGSGGRISFHNGLHGTAVDVQADVEGYVTQGTASSAGATFAPLNPTRVLDTSAGTGGRSTPLKAGNHWAFHVLGSGGVPTSGVSAVALNVGARATSTNCWVQVQPTGSAANNTAYPRVDTYTGYSAQQLAVVAPNSSGDITFTTNCSAADIYADTEGYYLAAGDVSSGDAYVPITNPTRVVDTRTNVGVNGRLTAGRVLKGSEAVPVVNVAGVPGNADAVALDVTALDGNTRGYNTVWTDGATQPAGASTVDVDPSVIESNLVFVQTGRNGRIDIADPSAARSEANDLTIDVEGYFYKPSTTPRASFATPHYFPSVIGDTYFNTVGTDGNIIATSDDTNGADNQCHAGRDIAILHMSGTGPAHLQISTVNCMVSFGQRGGGDSPDGCSWKSAGITRVGSTLYMAVARQLRECTYGKEAFGLQPSFDASIMKSVNDGRTWTNPWGMTGRGGAAPPYSAKLKRYRAMFPGQSFSAPFFIQYGPGNTDTANGGDKYLYAVSNDGYAYNGNYLHLARVPLDQVQNSNAWQYYHGSVGGLGRYWTSSVAGATRVLQSKRGISQPAIQYIPSLKRYVLVTFTYSRARSDFPTRSETPYTRFRFYTSPKPWGPWTQELDKGSQRNLWCTTSPCPLTEQPGSTAIRVGTPGDWLGLYDPTLVQKFVFSGPLTQETLFTSGDFRNQTRYSGTNLYRLHALPFNLAEAIGD